MEIIYSKSAVKAISRMDPATKQRVKQGIDRLPDGDVKKLTGHTSSYRLRIGGLRILFDISENIVITNILPRGDAYKK